MITDTLATPPTATLGASGVRPSSSSTHTREPRVVALERFAVSITLFNLLGHTVLGFEQSHWTLIVVPLWAYAVELGLEYLASVLEGRRARFTFGAKSFYEFLLPTQISSMAIAMLLFAGPTLWPYLFAVTVAVGSKYVVRAPVNGRWRHTLNPSNLGIAVTLLLFPWVGIAPPYQFTANVGQPWDWLIPILILTSGLILNLKLTRKGPLIAGWVLGFIAQALIRWAFFGTTAVGLAPLSGVAFILFTNYMITDPGTTPFKRLNQIAFGAGCAFMYGFLMVLHIDYTLFFALISVCLIRTVYLLTISKVHHE